MNPLLGTVLIEWLGLPELASRHGASVDHMNEIVHIFMAVLGIGWSIYLGYCIWRFRESKNPTPDYVGVRGHTTSHLEIGVVLVEAVLLAGFAIPLWAERAENPVEDGSEVKVRAIGYQFGWTFQYAGGDGVLGRYDPKYISPQNPWGLDPYDPNGWDDFYEAGRLYLPNERQAIIDVRSRDVIHNLAIKSMRIAQDAIPGVPANMKFVPIKEGAWDIICGQLCGAGHANMKATIEVGSESEFFEWYDQRVSMGADEAEARKGAVLGKDTPAEGADETGVEEAAPGGGEASSAEPEA